MNVKNSFEQYLSQIYVKNPFKIYSFPTSSGKFIISNEEDQQNFIKIYNTPIQHKGIGAGELAVRWLFNNNIKENHGGSNSDFIINGKEVEVKSYPSHTSKMTLGKFKSDITQRYVLNSVFSMYNNIQLFPEFYSEVNFNIETLKKGYDLLISTNPTSKKYQQLMLYITGSTSQEMAINTMNNLFRNKLEVKPGDGNYVINITPKDPLNIYVFKININKLSNMNYEEWYSNTDIQSCELRLNFSIFN